jgi:acyl transferase domain-containing protein
LACRFPCGANNPEKYWNILKNGVDTITDVPDSRWDGGAYYDPQPEAAGKMYTTQGGAHSHYRHGHIQINSVLLV